MLESKKLRKVEYTKILKTFCIYTEYLKPSEFNKLKQGYRDKNVIYYTDNALICTESHLNYLDLLVKEDGDYTDWKQVIITCDNETTETKVQADITGSLAKAIVLKNLYKYYTKEEVKEILSSYTTEYDYDKKQYHWNPSEPGLNKYENCVGYDINGAHCYFLTQMFPKAADYFIKLYKDRHIRPNNKKIANYFVGCLKTCGYECAYNWIVQNTTRLLLGFKRYVEGYSGITVYANTDGFLTQDPAKLIKGSDVLGEFKIEMQGTVYTYVDKNYFCIQYTDSKGKKVLKGNLLNEVREHVDLEKGIVVHYDKKYNEFKQYEATNITIEEIK